MFLFVDSETSGLLNRDLPIDHPGQPWITKLAADLTRQSGERMAMFETGIRAEGRKISEGATAVHGMSSRQADKEGLAQVVPLGMLVGMAAQARYVVGYGILGFDMKIVESLLIRMKKDTRLWIRPGLEFIDVMLACTEICKLPPTVAEASTYKWPSLDEACSIILDEPEREGHHEPWDDVQRTRRLFFELVKRGHIEVGP